MRQGFCTHCGLAIVWVKKVDKPDRFNRPLDAATGTTGFTIVQINGEDLVQFSTQYQLHQCTLENIEAHEVLQERRKAADRIKKSVEDKNTIKDLEKTLQAATQLIANQQNDLYAAEAMANSAASSQQAIQSQNNLDAFVTTNRRRLQFKLGDIYKDEFLSFVLLQTGLTHKSALHWTAEDLAQFCDAFDDWAPHQGFLHAPCPKCGAQKNERCRSLNMNTNGQHIQWPHPARKRAAYLD